MTKNLFDACLDTPRTAEEEAALDAAAAAAQANVEQREAARMAAAGFSKGDTVMIEGCLNHFRMLAIDEAFADDDGDPVVHLHCDDDGTLGFHTARLSQVRRA